jgi:hypothetical protein
MEAQFGGSSGFEPFERVRGPLGCWCSPYTSQDNQIAGIKPGLVEVSPARSLHGQRAFCVSQFVWRLGANALIRTLSGAGPNGITGARRTILKRLKWNMNCA